jgi:DNA-binding MarR family transcriptional regulator
MSVRQFSAACDLEDDRLNATDKAVMLVLANYADNNGNNCYPSIPTIAKKSCTSERSVQRSIKQLEALSYLHVDRGAGRRRSEYKLTLPEHLLKIFDTRRRKQYLKTVGHEEDKTAESHWDQLFAD